MTTIRLLLDGGALVANWRSLDRLSGSARAGAAVKADGYGFGAVDVTRRLLNAGCRNFFVAHWHEAEQLAALMADDAALSVLHGLAPGEETIARAVGAKPVLNTIGQVARWRAIGGGLCDVMIDTGMNRLGLAEADICDGLLEGLAIDLCMSHLASADEDSGQNDQQRARFDAVRTRVSARRYSLANSAGIMLGAGYHHDLTRPGIALYGGVVRPDMADIIQPVAGIEAQLLQVRQIEAGDTVGYGATFTAPQAMRIGCLSLGYADGYPRALSGIGRFTAGGRGLDVLGRVSMDLVCVDLGAALDLSEGDWVACDFDLRHIAAQTGLSQYEALTNLGQRFERSWRG